MPIKEILTSQHVPVKIWTDDVDEKSKQQLSNIASLPFIHHHVAAMPDVHLGIGATIGSVIATHKAIIPAAVGVDIGCGMVACRLSITGNDLDEKSLRKVFDQISRDVPVGRAQHQDDRTLVRAAKPFEARLNVMTQKHPQLLKAFGKFSKWVNQMGTLGGGNHFIEVCIDEANQVWVMLHSGSRGIGNALYQLIDSVFSEGQLFQPEDGRKAKKLETNANFEKQEFKELWNRINRKAAYSVDFDSAELVTKAVTAINDKNMGLRVTPLQYTIQHGEQAEGVTYDVINEGNAFTLKATETEKNVHSIHSAVKYDLIGKIAEGTQLTRRTTADILKGINVAVFAQFRTNPESFIAEAVRLINEQKATMIIEHLAYDPVEDKFDLDIFTTGQTKQDFSKAGDKLKRHIYDYVITDSGIERDFVKELDTCTEVVVYAKLPRGFLIPTPVGDYNPDWAVSFKEGMVKHVYFVAETKGSMSSMVLNEIEKTKIKCARKFFDEINKKYAPENVKYDVVNSFGKLMELVK